MYSTRTCLFKVCRLLAFHVFHMILCRLPEIHSATMAALSASVRAICPGAAPPFTGPKNRSVLRHHGLKNKFTHFSTIGLYGGPAHYDVSVRQADIEAFVTSSFKIFLTQTFPRCGATCYILPSRAMSQLFNGVNFLSLSGTYCHYLRVLVRIRNFYNSGRY